MFAQRRRFVNQARRLVYVTTKDHAYTLDGWATPLFQRGIDVTLMSYERLLPAQRVPAATYILTDFDRLSVSELQAAATVHERLRAHGLTVLNDPSLFTPRAALLKGLKRAGVNAFDCFLPVSGEWPDRFPVFLRTLAGHRGVLTDLLHDLNACREAWQAALTRGFTASDLAFIEFAATPTESGAYQKHAAYRIGDRIVRANTVNERHWMAKNGELGLATEAQYRQELEEMDNYPWRDLVMRVFEHAGATFGRLDFGITPAGPQIYEINTNPYLTILPDTNPHPNADRRRSLQRIRENLIEAFDAVTQAHPPGWVPLREKRQPVVRV